jgi:excisionase family DNA binding protein
MGFQMRGASEGFNENYMTTTQQSEWLTSTEAAAHLKVAPRTLVRWARSGLIPAHRLSGLSRVTWRFRREELDAKLCASSAGLADGETA